VAQRGTNERGTLIAAPLLLSRGGWADRLPQLVWLAGGAVLFLSLALDGRLHWDEPAYLYVGAFIPYDAIIEGDFQPSGIEGHYLSRLLHVLLIHALTQVTGPGAAALSLIISIYLALLLASAWISYLILIELLPRAERLMRAVLLAMFAPIYLYFAFKALPEIPAFFLSALAALALLRSLRGRAPLWLLVSSCALAAAAFCKNNMALLWISLVGALLVAPPVPLSRMKLVGHAAAAGGAALALSLAFLSLAGIELTQYLGVGAMLLGRDEPFVLALLNFLLEGGIFFLAVPLAFLSSHKRQAFFFTTWFVLATVPLFAVFEYVEARYLATNLIALTGLIWLVAEALRRHVIDWWQRRPLMTACSGAAAILMVAGSNGIALAIMPHELRMDQLDEIIDRLDRTEGGEYAILIPYVYTDFHYLRFVYPERGVYAVQSVFEGPHDDDWWRGLQDEYYGKRVIRSVRELAGLDAKLVYLGFEENFSVANLENLTSFVPILGLDRHFQQAQFLNHLTLSWIWQNPDVVLAERFRVGHYRVFDVALRPGASASSAEQPLQGAPM
jgi:hypothetical protein